MAILLNLVKSNAIPASQQAVVINDWQKCSVTEPCMFFWLTGTEHVLKQN